MAHGMGADDGAGVAAGAGGSGGLRVGVQPDDAAGIRKGARAGAEKRVWAVKDALEWTCGYLERKGDERPRRSAEWLMSAATGMSRVEIYAYYDRPLDTSELSALRVGIERRASGEPLQYVTGEVGFRHIVLRCEPGVLIPRPETEMLVEHALTALDASNVGPAYGDGEARTLQVLDLCTGTGCIALSIAQERENAHVVATDISPLAVQLARRNAAALGLEERVQVLECDLAGGLDARDEGCGDEGHSGDRDACDERDDRGDRGKFDLIVSNPPYIPTSELADLPREVAGFEPALALDGGDDGLNVFRRILAAACGLAEGEAARALDVGVSAADADATPVAPRSHSAPLLRAGGLLACELHETTLEAASDLCRAAGMVDVRVLQDLAGRDRVIIAAMPR